MVYSGLDDIAKANALAGKVSQEVRFDYYLYEASLNLDNELLVVRFNVDLTILLSFCNMACWSHNQLSSLSVSPIKYINRFS